MENRFCCLREHVICSTFMKTESRRSHAVQILKLTNDSIKVKNVLILGLFLLIQEYLIFACKMFVFQYLLDMEESPSPYWNINVFILDCHTSKTISMIWSYRWSWRWSIYIYKMYSEPGIYILEFQLKVTF